MSGHGRPAEVFKCSLFISFDSVFGCGCCACECHCMWRPEALGSLELELPSVVAEC